MNIHCGKIVFLMFFPCSLNKLEDTNQRKIFTVQTAQGFKSQKSYILLAYQHTKDTTVNHMI